MAAQLSKDFDPSLKAPRTERIRHRRAMRSRYARLPAMHPLVKVLFGDMQPRGRLPVTITEPPPSTTVLYPFGFHLQLP